MVVSGDAAAVEGSRGVRGQGRRVRPLRVSHAFHSARMDPVLAELGQAAAGLEHHAPRIAWAQALAGGLAGTCEPGYWARQAREPVRFADTVAALAGQGVRIFVEIGPDGTRPRSARPRCRTRARTTRGRVMPTARAPGAR